MFRSPFPYCLEELCLKSQEIVYREPLLLTLRLSSGAGL